MRGISPLNTPGGAGPRGERGGSGYKHGVPGADEQQQKRRLSTQEIRALLPDLYALIRPRRHVLLGGLLIVALNRIAGLVLPASSKFLIDDILGHGRHELLVPLVATVLTATMVQGLSGYFLTQIISKAAQRLIAQLRSDVQRHVVRLPLGYFDQHSTGVLVSRVMNDAEGLRNLIGTGLIDFIGGIITAVIALCVLLYISPLMTTLALLFTAVLGWSLARAFGRVRPIFRARSKLQGEVTGRLTESFGGIRVVKGYRAERHEEEVFAAGVERLLQNVLQSLSIVASMSLQSSVALGLVGGLTMYVGALQIISGNLTVGGFVTFSLFLGFLVAPTAQMASVGTQITEAFAGIERMKEVMGVKKEGEDDRRTKELGRIRGEVELEDVDFEYQAGEQVLHGISFRAAPGTITAFVGRSGAGKTTIISLLSQFYEPVRGRILVDGEDLSTVVLESYRAQIGMVLQETFLFDGTIKENVRFSKPDATDVEIQQACRIAHVDEFASRFPLGYDTIVGERGVKLSGGQRQRIAIARAILVDPRILILDEATSSLDTESERLIQSGLSHLMQGRTVFVIAHRLSTVRRADQILVIDGGRVIERGAHEELLAAGGRYAEMVKLQAGIVEDTLE